MSSLRLQPGIYGNQNLILDKLNHEAVQIHSIKAFYIPRKFVALDEILGEDRLSKFENAYPIDLYWESVNGYEGQGEFASKFGLMIQNSARVVLSKQGWAQNVAQYGTSVLPNRPTEGDLIHVPMTKGLFEVMFVDHQTPFYQLGQYYTYKLTIELFRYSSEKLDTGIEEIDAFEETHSTDITVRPALDDLVRGADNTKFVDRAKDLVWNSNNPFGEI